MTKERPILFSGGMVRAILDGRKTQTRRVVKPQFERAPVDVVDGVPSWDAPTNFGGEVQMNTSYGKPCPHGVPGDHLWVKETYFAFGRWETRFNVKKARDEWHFVDITTDSGREYQYPESFAPVATLPRGDVTPSWWKRPAIFMPRPASRILLQIGSVRVERLNDCSEADAAAEGVEPIDTERDYEDWSVCRRCGGTRLYTAYSGQGGALPGTDCLDCDTHLKRYSQLWDSINGAGAWEANPWVWVVEFKRIEA